LRPLVQFGLLRDDGRKDVFSDSLGAAVFAHLDDALRWKPQLAVVATPSSRHAELILPLLEAGVATFVEKPVVTQSLALDCLQKLDPTQLPPTQVGCILRFLPSLQRVRQWLEEDRIGRVVRASFEVGQWLPDWRPAQDYRQSYSASRASGGGVVFDLIHELDLAAWLLGNLELLDAWGQKSSSLDIDSEDVALIALRSASGALAAIQMDYVAREPIRRLQLIGDQGTITWDLPARHCSLRVAGQDAVLADGFDTASIYVAAMTELLESAERGGPTSLPLHEGLRATALAISANLRIRGTSHL
jgi:predicted dehydrogenase